MSIIDVMLVAADVKQVSRICACGNIIVIVQINTKDWFIFYPMSGHTVIVYYFYVRTCVLT